LFVTDGNLAPVLTSQPLTHAVENQTYAYHFSAADPNGDELTFSLIEGPIGMNVDSANGLVEWLPASVQTHLISLRVTDPYGASATQSYLLTVEQESYPAPRITSSPLQQAYVGQRYRYNLNVDNPSGNALDFHLDQGSPGMSLSPTGLFSWIPQPTDIGFHNVTLRVRDSQGSSDSQAFELHVLPQVDNQEPHISLNLDPSQPALGDTVQVTLIIEDESPITSKTLTLNGAPVALSSDQASFVADTIGIYHLAATALDDAGNMGSIERLFSITDPSDTTPPVVAIHSPLDHSEQTAPTSIIISVQDDHLLDYELTNN